MNKSNIEKLYHSSIGGDEPEIIKKDCDNILNNSFQIYEGYRRFKRFSQIYFESEDSDTIRKVKKNSEQKKIEVKEEIIKHN